MPGAVARRLRRSGSSSTERDFFDAFVRARELQPHAPDNAELAGLWKEISGTRSITTDPPGAEMAIAGTTRRTPSGS